MNKIFEIKMQRLLKVTHNSHLTIVKRIIESNDRSDIVFSKVFDDLLVSLGGHIDHWIQIGKGQ